MLPVSGKSKYLCFVNNTKNDFFSNTGMRLFVFYKFLDAEHKSKLLYHVTILKKFAIKVVKKAVFTNFVIL